MENNKAQILKVSKDFEVPVEKLFQAWNDPVQLKQWWKPLGNQLTEVINDLSIGGTVRYTFNDNTLIISGKYADVKENERLTYTWNWEFPEEGVKNAAYYLTVEFAKNGDNSSIHITQENDQDGETLQPNMAGWDKALADLEAFLNSKAGNSSQSNVKNNSNAEEAGYRESPEQQKVGGG
jgi:uncharacterized protein YndB with AHSA1/START domain